MLNLAFLLGGVEGDRIFIAYKTILSVYKSFLAVSQPNKLSSFSGQ
ncbi:hypothetical protein NIES4074_13330 [Cylindrospermum sp. NIES-4074]|nr:hypothetical protein NIES4074_13330 [Cylindrospermum sp. NIES-4074]